MALAGLLTASLASLAGARSAYVTGVHSGTSFAAPIDLQTHLVGGRIAFGSSSESGPEDVAISPDGKTAYVLNNFPSIVRPIDVATNVAGTDIPVQEFGRAIAISPDGRFAYVTVSFGSAGIVQKIDLTTGAKTEFSVGSFPSGIAITPDGTKAYVAAGTNSVYPIDLVNGVVGTPIVVGNSPIGVAVTPDGTSVYVANAGDGTLSRIDVATNTVTATIANTEGFDLAITPDGTKAYVITSGEVVPVDLITGTAGAAIPIASLAEDVAILPDGTRAFLTGLQNNQPFEGVITPINTGTNAAEAQFVVSNGGTKAIAIVPNQPPHAAFSDSPSAPTPGAAVSFNGNGSTDSDGTVARYDWDFGDGGAAANAGPTPNHAYAKAGTYQVTLTTTDNEGCSTKFVFTGQTAYCNGSDVARVTHPVKVAGNCPRVQGGATSFVPKLRSTHVVPGVRVRLKVSAPAHLEVQGTLLWTKEGESGRAGLGSLSVDVDHWRRIRLPIPAALRSKLTLGTPVKVSLRIQTTPRNGSACVGSVSHPTLRVRVVKVNPLKVQFARPR